MTRRAQSFNALLFALGAFAAGFAAGEWRLDEPARFFSFLFLAAAASVLKMAAPAMAGRMPLNFLFVLVAVIELNLPEATVVGCAALLIERIWDARSRSRVVRLCLSAAQLVLAIAVAHESYSRLERIGALPDFILIGFSTTLFYAFNTFPASILARLNGGESLVKHWRERHLTQYPRYLFGAALAWGFHQTAQILGWPAALLLLPVVYFLLRTYRLYLARIEDEKVHAEELADLHMRTIEALALAIEAKDNTTSEHLRRVQVYAMDLGRELGMDDRELEALRAAAVLHDIGKLAVPEHIISKPGRLTPEEFEKMKIHPVVGAEILEHVKFPYPVVPIVRAHHEKWNGTGYPYGLKGENIPLGARILAAVDALDALATDRQYRRALPLNEAMQHVIEESGRSFDPHVVDLLKSRYVELEQRAQAANGITLKLSTDVKITRGAAPAGGFEASRTIEIAGDAPDFYQAVATCRQDIQLLFESGLSTTDMTTDEILAVFAQRLKRLIPHEAIAIWLIQQGRLIPYYVHGDNYRLFTSLRIPVGQGLSGWVAENRKPIINGNPSVESGYLNDPNSFSTLRSALAAPLEGTAGAIGVVTLYGDARDAFTRNHLRILTAIAPRLGLAIEHAMGNTAAPDSRAAERDCVGLLRSLARQLARAKQMDSRVAVLVCSVRGIGSEIPGAPDRGLILASAEDAIRECCREHDYFARTSDLEFVVTLQGLTDSAVRAAAARLRQIVLGPPGSPVTLSVAEAQYPHDGVHGEQLLAAADRRLFSGGYAQAAKAAAGTPQSSTPWVQ